MIEEKFYATYPELPDRFAKLANVELRRYKAIAMDVGDRDGLKTDAAKLHEVFDQYGLANSFEIYPGDHTSDVATRFQDYVLPFFGKNLAFQAR